MCACMHKSEREKDDREGRGKKAREREDLNFQNVFSRDWWWFVNGVLMDCASLMGSLALDLSWSHAGQTHKTTSTHILCTNWIDTVILGIALGLIINTRTAKYLTPRLLGYAAKTHKLHTKTHVYIKYSHTLIKTNTNTFSEAYFHIGHLLMHFSAWFCFWFCLCVHQFSIYTILCEILSSVKFPVWVKRETITARQSETADLRQAVT